MKTKLLFLALLFCLSCKKETEPDRYLSEWEFYSVTCFNYNYKINIRTTKQGNHDHSVLMQKYDSISGGWVNSETKNGMTNGIIYFNVNTRDSAIHVRIATTSSYCGWWYSNDTIIKRR